MAKVAVAVAVTLVSVAVTVARIVAVVAVVEAIIIVVDLSIDVAATEALIFRDGVAIVDAAIMLCARVAHINLRHQILLFSVSDMFLGSGFRFLLWLRLLSRWSWGSLGLRGGLWLRASLRGDTHISEDRDLIDVEEGIVVVLVRLGWRGMRFRDVVTSKVITLIAGILVMLFDNLRANRLVDGCINFTDRKQLPLWLQKFDAFSAITAAVSSNMEYLLDFLTHNWPFCGVDGHFVASKVIVFEASLFFFLKLLCEFGIHKEDWGLELFVAWVDGLEVFGAFEENLEFGGRSQDRAPFCFLGIPFFQSEGEFVTSAELGWLLSGSIFCSVGFCSKFWKLAIKFICPSLLISIIMNTAISFAKGSGLHDRSDHIGFKRHRNSKEG